MEKLEQYKRAVQQILSEYAQYMATSDDFQLETIFDTERNHYQLMVVGWRGHERIYSPLLHIDIIDGKIWVQNNNTQFTLIDDFDKFGIDRQDIVNGLIPAHRRRAVAAA